MRLFHLSENGKIQSFSPRRSKKQWSYRNYVWAISEDKLHNYLLPRNCPRICLPTLNLRPIKEWIDYSRVRTRRALIFVPQAWAGRIKDCTLYQYEFEPANFSMIDAIAGYYVSEKEETPIALNTLENCLQILDAMDVEVVFLEQPQLQAVREVVIATMEDFSVIRWDYLR